MNINNLPSEISRRIFKGLHPNDWLTCEFVCKGWCEILRSFWNNLEEVEFESCNYMRLTFHDAGSYKFTSLGDCDDVLLGFVLKRSGGYLKKLILHMPQEWSSGKTSAAETLILVGSSCKHLKMLRLDGNVSSVADSISVLCRDLVELEELSIWDDDFYDEAAASGSNSNNDDVVNSASLVGNIVSTCHQLRVINLVFYFTLPPSAETCRLLSHLEHIERIRWLFWSPLSPEYVENVFASLSSCATGTIRELSFGCKLKAPLNEAACADHLRSIARACPNVEIIDLGFQLHVAKHEAGSDEVYYDPIDSAPWTREMLAALTSFSRVRELSLRHFDFSSSSEDGVLFESLKRLCENVQVLRIEDNYGVTGRLIWELGNTAKNLRFVGISQAVLSHADLVDLVQRCPTLSNLRLSNVDGMSFKRLVLAAHAALHHCGGGGLGGTLPALNLKLDTARSYVHDEADELKNVRLCGLTLLPPTHSNVVIDRVCRKVQAAGSTD